MLRVKYIACRSLKVASSKFIYSNLAHFYTKLFEMEYVRYGWYAVFQFQACINWNHVLKAYKETAKRYIFFMSIYTTMKSGRTESNVQL